MKNFAQTKAQRQAEWMAAFSDAVVTAKPELAGKICWDTAKFYYFNGKKSTEAAAEYVGNRGQE